jgi:hypothetical protein
MYKKMYLFEVKNAFDHVLKVKNGEYLAYNLSDLLESLGQYMGVENQCLYNSVVELIEHGETTLYDHIYILKEKEFRAEAIAALKQEAQDLKENLNK